MYEILLMIHVVICAGLVGLILIQQGKGSGMGSLGGGSQSLFGAEGSATFLSRLTAIFATGFFLTSLFLSLLAIKQVNEAKQAALPVISMSQDERSDVPSTPVVESDVVLDTPVIIDKQEAAETAETAQGVVPVSTQGVERAPADPLPTVPADQNGQ